jgi:hypothetical protein
MVGAVCSGWIGRWERWLVEGSRRAYRRTVLRVVVAAAAVDDVVAAAVALGDDVVVAGVVVIGIQSREADHLLACSGPGPDCASSSSASGFGFHHHPLLRDLRWGLEIPAMVDHTIVVAANHLVWEGTPCVSRTSVQTAALMARPAGTRISLQDTVVEAAGCQLGCGCCWSR